MLDRCRSLLNVKRRSDARNLQGRIKALYTKEVKFRNLQEYARIDDPLANSLCIFFRKYLSATPRDLWEAIQESIDASESQAILPAGVLLSVIMNDWAELPGYPIVNVKRDAQKSQFIITQVSFCEAVFTVC